MAANDDQEAENAYPDGLMLTMSQKYECGKIAIDSRNFCIDDNIQWFGPVVCDDDP